MRELTAPTQVWVCWCAACGRVDYAYTEPPKTSGADCPACELDRSYKNIAGPYLLQRPPDASSPDHALLLRALCLGVARWDRWPDGKRGEVAVDGILHAVHLDAFGCPDIDAHLRAKLTAAIAAAEAP